MIHHGQPAPQIIVVGSGKGGTGTSVVAALVALAAASTGRRVLLVDADEHVGPQRYLLGTAPSPTIADLRGGGVDVATLPVPVSATLSLVPGGPPAFVGAGRSASARPGTEYPLDPAERRALLRRVSALYPEHDLVVVDGGSRLDTVCACCDAVGGSVPARLLVVTGTEPIALAASYALVKATRTAGAAQPGGPVTTDVVVNRADETAAGHAFAQMEQACRDFLGATVRLTGVLPDDTCLEVALRAGMPLQDAAAGSPAAVAAQTLADRLLADLAGGGGRPTPRSAARPANPYASSPLLARAGALR